MLISILSNYTAHIGQIIVLKPHDAIVVKILVKLFT